MSYKYKFGLGDKVIISDTAKTHPGYTWWGWWAENHRLKYYNNDSPPKNDFYEMHGEIVAVGIHPLYTRQNMYGVRVKASPYKDIIVEEGSLELVETAEDVVSDGHYEVASPTPPTPNEIHLRLDRIESKLDVGES
jgi:hypothetical protein